MKKTFLKGALAALVGVGLMAGGAMAAPMTWTDTIDFNPDVLVPPTFDYYHDISDDGFASVWMGGDDTISGFDLEVSLYDDNQPQVTQELQFVGWEWIYPVFDWVTVTTPDGNESAYISFGLETQSYDFSSGSESYTANFWGAVDLWWDGTLNVRISSDVGDFYVASSSLEVYGDNGAAPVPEPATMLLFGTGLAGLAAARRRKK